MIFYKVNLFFSEKNIYNILNGGSRWLYFTLYGSNKFIDIKDSKNIQNDTIYLNITNRCHCSCTFCIRENINEGNNLWLEKEPTLEQIINEFENININSCKEIVFCGFGEPLERADIVMQVSKYLKKQNPNIKIRLNTNGLGNLINNKDITPMLNGLIDVISISLNASSEEKYLELTKSNFGIKSFDEVLKFIEKCKQHVPSIVLTVVDVIDEEEIHKCEKICAAFSVPLRIRHKI